MKLPAWLEDLTDRYGSKRLAGDITRQEAVTALRDAIIEQDDRPLILGALAEFAGKALDSWHREHQYAPAPAAVSSLQGDLFPDLPPRLYIRVGVSKPVMMLNAHDWDSAREMILNRTKHAIDGAEADRDRFLEAFGRVRPLLSDADATTADVVRQLRGEVPLEGLA